jgi:hypothetical protein
MLFGCGFRRSELVGLELEHPQRGGQRRSSCVE